MNNQDLLECSESVLNFLVKSEKEFNKLKHFSVPSYINMEKILKKHNTNMCDFAEILNKRLHLLNEPLWINTPKEFFSNHVISEKFFENAIDILSRYKKISKLKQKI